MSSEPLRKGKNGTISTMLFNRTVNICREVKKPKSADKLFLIFASSFTKSTNFTGCPLQISTYSLKNFSINLNGALSAYAMTQKRYVWTSRWFTMFGKQTRGNEKDLLIVNINFKFIEV